MTEASVLLYIKNISWFDFTVWKFLKNAVTSGHTRFLLVVFKTMKYKKFPVLFYRLGMIIIITAHYLMQLILLIHV